MNSTKKSKPRHTAIAIFLLLLYILLTAFSGNFYVWFTRQTVVFIIAPLAGIIFFWRLPKSSRTAASDHSNAKRLLAHASRWFIIAAAAVLIAFGLLGIKVQNYYLKDIPAHITHDYKTASGRAEIEHRVRRGPDYQEVTVDGRTLKNYSLLNAPEHYEKQKLNYHYLPHSKYVIDITKN